MTKKSSIHTRKNLRKRGCHNVYPYFMHRNLSPQASKNNIIDASKLHSTLVIQEIFVSNARTLQRLSCFHLKVQLSQVLLGIIHHKS